MFLRAQDGHEICFVGDEGFRELSKVDPAADKLIDEVNCVTTCEHALLTLFIILGNGK